MQRVDALVGDAVADDLAKLRRQRQHGAEHFADGRNVILRDPATELHQFGGERGSGIEHLAQPLGSELRLAVVQFGDDAGEALLAERHDDAAAHDRLGEFSGMR